MTVGEHIGLARQLHKGVGVLPGHRKGAAWAVVLEGTRKQESAVGEQSAGDAVTLETLVRLAVETEI
ncbi:hypothetical protein D3C81_2014350 [compost metagenome]